jgi:heavy metal sensor kinase
VRSVAARLTLSYSAAFALTATAGLVMVYFMTSTYLAHESDQTLTYFRDEISAKFRTMELPAFKTDILTETTARGTGEVVVRVVSASGNLVFCSKATDWQGLPDAKTVSKIAISGDSLFVSRSGVAGGHDARMLYARIGNGQVLEIGLSERDHEVFLRKLRWASTIILVLLVAVGALVGWAMARRAMSGVNAVISAAALIAEGTLDQRVTVGREGREIQKLATTFNSMAERLQTLIAKMKETNDNIAHDLRSPITRMRCNAEMPLLGEFGEEQYQEYASRIIEDCDRLLSIVNTMLDISEFEAGVARVKQERVDLEELCRDAVDIFEAAAEAQSKTLTCRAEAEAIIPGDTAQLQRVVATLLDNALKYTDSGSRIEVTVGSRGDRACFSVSDNGPGMSETDSSRVFERFYRADRSRALKGNGLGLSLALAIVEAHGGELSVESALKEGTTFTACFPQA